MTSQSLYSSALRKLQNRLDLDCEEAERLLIAIFEQQLTEIQIAAFLAALAVKGESSGEVVGFVRGMRRFALKLEHRKNNLVDTAGTGGDASGTFNISTCSAFVIAGAGIPVAKHGNRAMSGKCGSADVLSQLGVNISAPREVLEECLERCGITFLFAPSFHPAMKSVAKVRKELGVRSVFNLIGPLLNPAGARRQIIGVFSEKFTEVLAEALLQLDSEHALVFSGGGGLDEISVTDETKITEVRAGRVRSFSVTPEEFGLPRYDRNELLGGDSELSAQILIDVLGNQTHGARRDVVLLNAAAGLYVSGRSPSLLDGLSIARESLLSGAALAKLKSLVEFSNHSSLASAQQQ